MMLIGCLEQESLKNELNSDVNSNLKSDLIIEIDFSINFNKQTSAMVSHLTLNNFLSDSQECYLHNN